MSEESIEKKFQKPIEEQRKYYEQLQKSGITDLINRTLEPIKRFQESIAKSVRPIELPDLSIIKSPDSIREENAEDRHQEMIEVLKKMNYNMEATDSKARNSIKLSLVIGFFVILGALVTILLYLKG